MKKIIETLIAINHINEDIAHLRHMAEIMLTDTNIDNALIEIEFERALPKDAMPPPHPKDDTPPKSGTQKVVVMGKTLNIGDFINNLIPNMQEIMNEMDGEGWKNKAEAQNGIENHNFGDMFDTKFTIDLIMLMIRYKLKQKMQLMRQLKKLGVILPK